MAQMLHVLPGMPPGQALGPLCRRGHRWHGLDGSLRYVSGGKCAECEKIRKSTPEYKAKNRAWVAAWGRERYGSDPEYREQKLAKNRARNRARRSDPEKKAADYASKTRYREGLKAQGLTARGTPRVAPCEAYWELYRWLKKPRLLPSVVELVEEERRRHWRECPEDGKPLRAFYAAALWRFRYMIDPDLRTYNREKSKRRKATERKVWLQRVTPAQLRKRFREFDHLCAYCGDGGDLHMDHFHPLAAGGPHVLGNLLPACQRCNYSKRDKHPEEWYRAQPFFTESRWRKILRALGKAKHDPGQLSMW